MLEIKVNENGVVERLAFNGCLVEMQSDFTVAMAATYSALINNDAKDDAEQFVSGIGCLLSDKEAREKIFGAYANAIEKSDRIKTCKVEKTSKENPRKLTETQLDDALKKLQEIARTLGIKDDD